MWKIEQSTKETTYPKLEPGSYSLSPKDIRFTQATIGTHFSDGRRVDDLVDQLRTGAVLPRDLPPIQVVQKDGLLFSLDNRRLMAFNLAGVSEIPVQVVSLDDPGVAERLRYRFDPVLSRGEYVVVASRETRDETLDLLYQHEMIRGIHREH